MKRTESRPTPVVSSSLVALLVTCCMGLVQAADWPSYGSDLHSTKYAPLDQIDASNASQLSIAWSWDSPDNQTVAANHAAQNFRATPAGYKVTPIAIDGILYVSTSFGRVAAIDGASGEELWVFDTRSWEAGRPANLGYNHRGVSYWREGDKQRILMPANDAWLWSLDAVTGQPDPDFGDGGKLDLAQGLGREIDRSAYTMISAPLIIDDIVILGSSIHDGPRNKEAPPGHVRGFNVRTGEQIWIFHTIPQGGEFGNDSWEDNSWEYSGNTNVWTVMSADEELGYVYLPIGTPTNDWYGGHRLGDNLFAESLVAIEAKTGKRVWHFQMVHHGVWDYDLPAAPNLVDLVVDGKPVKALAQISKQGFVYVFDRVSGEPIWPIEERPVPQSSVPGERLSPTQPFPTRPAPFEPQGISDATLINFTPELRAEALRNIERFDYGPLFTPPSLRGTINLPGWAGGGGWQGAAVDPETGMLYIPSGTGPIVVQLVEPEEGTSNFQYLRGGATSAPGPQGLPLTKPPYGRITAINLNTGEHEWMIPHGEGIRQRLIDMGIMDPGPVGSADRTGPVLTKTLLFVGQTDNGRNLLRAFDKATGEVIQEYELPGAPAGTPMTYMANGKQYIAMAIGGGTDAKVVALALP
ncbi:MAG: pyrroloquinoline quinone-dependent dehydrogenase [Pseudomonadales bacterium]|nr:pyrroloquinoline quinone-dependent dehydrogenase [Pseudomonadales bacterium]